jgi:hypothetical protein
MSRVRSAGITLLLLAALPGHVLAQDALPMSAESLVHERAGVLVGCGIRVTGGSAAPRAASSWFDVSVNVFRRGFAVAQAIAYEMPRSTFDVEARPAQVPIQSAWIAAGEGSAKLGESAERQASLIYTLAMDDAISVFDAAARGSPLTLGIKRWGQRSASVHGGAATLTHESRDRIAACLARLAA